MRYHNQQCEKERFSASGVSSTRSSISSIRSSISSLDKFENHCSINEPEGQGAGFDIQRTSSPEPMNNLTAPDYARTMRAFTMDQLRRDGLEHTVNTKQHQPQSYGGSSGPRGVGSSTQHTHTAASIHAGRPQQPRAPEIPRVPRNSPITYGQKKCINSPSSRHYRMAPEPLCRDFAAS